MRTELVVVIFIILLYLICQIVTNNAQAGTIYYCISENVPLTLFFLELELLEDLLERPPRPVIIIVVVEQLTRIDGARPKKASSPTSPSLANRLL